MNTELEIELRRLFEEDVNRTKSSRNLVDAVMPRLGTRPERKWWSGLVPRTGLAWAVGALVISLIGGTAYGATSLVRELMHTLAPDVEPGGLVTDLHLSQTIDGVTVTLEAGYADANTVLLGYTITGRNAGYDQSARRLYLVDGTELDGMAGTGYVPSPDVLGWRPTTSTVVAGFDGTAIQGDPSEISLRFETSPSDKPMAGDETGYGSFIFDFTLPFHGGKNVMVVQTVEAAGIPITLEKILISPAGTSAVFHYYEDRKTDDRPFAIATLEMPSDEGGVVTINSKQGDLEDSYYMEYFLGDFTQRIGKWTVTVKELVLIDRTAKGPGKASDTIRIAGPWVFRFEVKP